MARKLAASSADTNGSVDIPLRYGDCGRAIRLGWVDILVLCRAGHGGSEPTNTVFGWSSPCASDNCSQPASFLPPCLMKFGESVIPSATNSFSKQVAFRQIFVNRAALWTCSLMKWRNLRKRQKSRKASQSCYSGGAWPLSRFCSSASNASESIPAGHPEGVWVSEELTK